MSAANPERGRVPLTVGDRVFTLVWNMDSLCQLEELFSTPKLRVTMFDIIPLLQRMSITHIRGCLWAALRECHEEVTLKQAGELITAAGGIAVVVTKLVELQASLSADEEDKPKRPRRARPVNGTGAPATSSLDASASTEIASGNSPSRSSSVR